MGKRYNYKTLAEMVEARAGFEAHGDTVTSYSNIYTGLFWIEVVLEGEVAVKELPEC